MSPTTKTADSEASAASVESVTEILEAWTKESRTGLIPHREVIDHLLDLRNVVQYDQRIFIDSVLVDLPGRSVVESSWWNQQIADLQLLLHDGR